MTLSNLLKRLGGSGFALLPQCRFDRCVLLIGHMRCGSTALANILCSRPEISGYGETHVRYDSATAPGRLALNQLRRGAWKPRARHLFDKLLHDGLDADPPPGFFDARAVFLIRDPVAAIPSVVGLFRALGSDEYDLPAAADYYAARVDRMIALWTAFPPTRRIALCYEALLMGPETELGRLSEFLDLRPGLANSYAPNARARALGAGDPLTAHRFSAIVAGGTVPPASAPGAMPELEAASRAYHRFCRIALSGGSEPLRKVARR